MTKSYSPKITDQLLVIAGVLNAKMLSQGIHPRELAKAAGLTQASVRAVLEGRTGNIATYLLVIEALGTTLEAVIDKIHQTEAKRAV